MNKNLLLCSVCAFCICRPAAHRQTQNPQTTINQHVFQTVVHQNMLIETHPEDLFGEELNTYLNNLDTKTFKVFFPKLSARAKIMYMLNINPDQYERFLDRYTDKEWSDFWLASSQEEKNVLPKTRQEQLALLRDAYYAYLEQHGSMFYSYFNQKASYPSDLAALKKQFYKDNAISGIQKGDMTSFSRNAKQEFLKAYMLRRRNELFNL